MVAPPHLFILYVHTNDSNDNILFLNNHLYFYYYYMFLLDGEDYIPSLQPQPVSGLLKKSWSQVYLFPIRDINC